MKFSSQEEVTIVELVSASQLIIQDPEISSGEEV